MIHDLSSMIHDPSSMIHHLSSIGVIHASTYRTYFRKLLLSLTCVQVLRVGNVTPSKLYLLTPSKLLRVSYLLAFRYSEWAMFALGWHWDKNMHPLRQFQTQMRQFKECSGRSTRPHPRSTGVFYSSTYRTYFRNVTSQALPERRCASRAEQRGVI